MFTLEYADGYYIAKDGKGVIDFDDSENREFAEFVLNAVNHANKNRNASHTCPTHPQIFDVDGCFVCDR